MTYKQLRTRIRLEHIAGAELMLDDTTTFADQDISAGETCAIIGICGFSVFSVNFRMESNPSCEEGKACKARMSTLFK